MKDGCPVEIYAESPNYTQAGFSMGRRKYIVDCDPVAALIYFNQVKCDSIFCNHSEVEEEMVFLPTHPILESEDNQAMTLQETDVSSVTLSLLINKEETGYGSE